MRALSSRSHIFKVSNSLPLSPTTYQNAAPFVCLCAGRQEARLERVREREKCARKKTGHCLGGRVPERQ